MKAQEIKERLDKAEDKVDKCKATIERHKAQAEKKLQQLQAKGWSLEPEDNRSNNEAFWLSCDYRHKLEDVEGAIKKLAEAEQIVANWKEKLQKQLELETTIALKMPEVFRELKDELTERWVQGDLKQAEEMRAAKKELEYKEFRKRYKYSMEMELSKTEEEFRRIESREAELFIIDLYNRVKAITGEVTDWSHIRYGGKSLNGYVTGENGTAEVFTIGAGGYNIQRFHLRVLVKERG